MEVSLQPVAATISARVAPLARFMRAMTSAFLFARSALGLLTGFFVCRAFFAALTFLAVGLRRGCRASVPSFPGIRLCWCSSVSPDRAAVVTIHHSGREKLQGES